MASVSSVGSGLLTGSGSDWIADTMTAIQNSAYTGGMLGALANARGSKGTIKSYLRQNTLASTNFALISQGNLSNTSAYYAQLAAQNQDKRAQEVLRKTLEALTQSQNQVKAQNVLDPFIYLADGTSIDTESSIMTRPDGTQYDIRTGAKYVDPASVIQMANGAYLDTKNNILTMPDGTRIDTVTGLKVTTTA